MQKIAIITDSASDIPLEVIKEKNINLLPLRIIYSHGDYQDKLDITPEEIYLNLDKEIPTTSLPITAIILLIKSYNLLKLKIIM